MTPRTFGNEAEWIAFECGDEPPKGGGLVRMAAACCALILVTALEAIEGIFRNN